MDFSAEQPEKAILSISVTLSEMLTLVSVILSEKEQEPIFVTV